MKILISELQILLNNNVYYSALALALQVPDICGALEAENGKATGDQYRAWFNTYCGKEYEGFFNGSDVWNVRCSFLHQGKVNHKNAAFERLIFQLPLQNGPTLHTVRGDNSIILNLKCFIEAIIKGYEHWWKDNESSIFVQRNLEESLKFYPMGIYPDVYGIPVIS